MKVTCSFMLLLVMAVAACDSGKGPDSLFGRLSPHTAGTVSPCTRCHSSSNSPVLDPLATGGTGTAGKHVKHVTERGIDCEVCHKNYMTNPNHINGTIDTGSSAATAVSFSVTGPAGAWINVTGPGTGNCSGVACHGATTMEWYGTTGWTLPACTECHASAFSPALDPAATNGASPAGRHAKHVSSRGIGCERCHHQYPSHLTHMNGRMDTTDPTAALMSFNITGPSGAWINDGPDTGQCSGVSCHGTDTLDWYGTGTWTLPSSCTTCHASSFSSALDPTLTNGNGLAGKHGRHVASIGFPCAKCHLGYAASAPHMSGVMDTQDPAVRLVLFDSTNPSGAWVGDTGPETGICSSLFCHGAETPEWYGLAGVTPATTCAVCHGSAIGTRRQVMGANGDFGLNPNIVSHHVTAGPGSDPGTDQCLVCHEMSQHMGGTVRLKNADTAAAVAYDPAIPSSLEPFCLSCHDADGAAATFRTGGTPTAPFIDGSVLGQNPYRASVDIRNNWNKAFGHKQKGISCLQTGVPNTGCHANGHGSPFIGILAKNMQIPQPDRYRETDFDMCLNCHGSFPAVTKEVVFGVRFNGNYDQPDGPPQNPVLREGLANNPPYDLPGGIKTKFRDRNGQLSGNFYDDRPNFFVQGNLHWTHIGVQAWSYRGSAQDLILCTDCTGISCTACHSVHGSNTQFGMVYDSMLYSHTTVSVDTFSTMSVDPTTLLEQYPTYCALNCHDNLPNPTHGWFEPANE